MSASIHGKVLHLPTEYDMKNSQLTKYKNWVAEQLDTRYCPDGWSVRQVVHHVVDSHMNTYILFRRAVTEDKPIILPYDEKQWANLADYHMPIENSLILLETLHKRLVYFLRNLTLLDFERKFINIDTNEASVGENIGSYAWHGKQHLAQITSLIERSSW